MSATPDSNAYRAPNDMRMNLESDPVDRYSVIRTPSPTPSEVRALTTHIVDYKRYGHWRFWAKKEWIKYYIIGGIILILTILISVYDKQIVKWLTPAGKKIRHIPFGWLIPVAILFVISFPPLFGHEVVALFVGVIWGLGIGFAIVCAGTFLGELGNFFAFKYLCRARAEKAEKSSIFYGCLAQIVRDGGFKMALLIRLSVIPGHFSTAVFSTCGMSVWVFALAAFCSLPKQFINVYIGVILEESGTGTETPRDKIISDSVLGVTIIITVGAMYYIIKEMERVKPIVVYSRRKRRQAKLSQDPTMPLDPNNPMSTSAYETDVVAPLPKRISTQLGNILSPGRQQQRRGSGANMGYGGYTPTFIKQQYGEPDSEHDELYERFGVRKSMDDVHWEMRPSQTVSVKLVGGKDDDQSHNGDIGASSSQTSLLPHNRTQTQDSTPRTLTPERYTTSPDALAQQASSQQAQAQSQGHLYPPGLNTGVSNALSSTMAYPPPSQPPQPLPTYNAPFYQQIPNPASSSNPNSNPYQSPVYDRRAFQISDPPVLQSPLQQPSSHAPNPSDDSTLLPYAARYPRPSESSLDKPFDNPYDPAYQYALYPPPSHSGYPSSSSTGTSQYGHGYGPELSTSTSTFSNTSSDQSYSEHTAFTGQTPNPNAQYQGYYPPPQRS